MNILEHLGAIDGLIERREDGERSDFLMAIGGGGVNGLGFSSGTTWDPATPWAARQDTDRDGVVDALDNSWGAGAHDPLEHESPSGVTWNQATPWAAKQDGDGDGVADAHDNFWGAGAHNPLEHENPSGVTWDQATPWATRQDTDNDGVVDAHDNYWGPGAHDPLEG